MTEEATDNLPRKEKCTLSFMEIILYWQGIFSIQPTIRIMRFICKTIPEQFTHFLEKPECNIPNTYGNLT